MDDSLSAGERGVPEISDHVACELVERHFGVHGVVSRLPSYCDVNFQIAVDGQSAFVFKVANVSETAGALESQGAVFLHLAQRDAPFRYPSLVPTLEGKDVITVEDARDRPCLARLLTFVPGEVAGVAVPRPWDGAMLGSIGRTVGQLATGLQGFDHPAAHRIFLWDSAHAGPTVRDRLIYVRSPEHRAILEWALTRFDTIVAPVIHTMRTSVIHNDANDYNLVVGEADSVVAVRGLIDFGDLIHSISAAELSVAAAYALLDQPDPIDAIRRVAHAFHRRFPLVECEREALFDLVVVRLAMIVAISAEQQRRDPENEYLGISERPAWTALEHLRELDPAGAIDRIWGDAS